MKNYLLVLMMVFAVAGCDQNVRSDDDSADGGAEAGAVNDGGISGEAMENVSYEKGAINDSESILSRKIVYFDFDSSKVKDDFVELLKHHGKYLAVNKDASVRVEGHTDERGTREYNVALADRRAQSVKRLLLFQGASADQITVISYGEEKPVAMGHDESAWKLNRRAELVYK